MATPKGFTKPAKWTQDDARIFFKLAEKAGFDKLYSVGIQRLHLRVHKKSGLASWEYKYSTMVRYTEAEKHADSELQDRIVTRWHKIRDFNSGDRSCPTQATLAKLGEDPASSKAIARENTAKSATRAAVDKAAAAQTLRAWLALWTSLEGGRVGRDGLPLPEDRQRVDRQVLTKAFAKLLDISTCQLV